MKVRLFTETMQPVEHLPREVEDGIYVLVYRSMEGPPVMRVFVFEGVNYANQAEPYAVFREAKHSHVYGVKP